LAAKSGNSNSSSLCPRIVLQIAKPGCYRFSTSLQSENKFWKMARERFDYTIVNLYTAVYIHSFIIILILS